MPTLPLQPCDSPSDRAWPIQYLEFQREITSDRDPAGIIPGSIALQGAPITMNVRGSVLAKFQQQWTVANILVGDFVTMISLAPGEVLTIEMRRTQHSLLEQSQENASTVETGTESLDSDKESINVANTSARTANWVISGSGGFSMNGIGASASATNNTTINNSITSTINSIHETTVKSTKKLTTQTKLQVRGVTETSVEARQTRILRNPFPDRALDLSLYEIVKKFTVQTSQDSLSLMITATLSPINFTQTLISSNQAFLQEALLDDQLRDSLPTIVGALRQAHPSDQQVIINNALDMLEKFLFEDRPGVQPYHNSDYQNDTPLNAFTNANVNAPPAFTNINSGASGKAITLSTSAGFELFLNLQMYWMIMGGYPSGAALPPSSAVYPANRLTMMQGLAQKVKDCWEKLDDGARIALMKEDNRTEIFRRVPGFLQLFNDLLGNLTIEVPDVTTEALINALLNHLNSNSGYYTAQFLRFAWNKLGSTFVIRFTNDILAGLFPAPSGYTADASRPYLNLYAVEDVRRNGLCIQIPLQVSALPGSASIPNFIPALTQLSSVINAATPGQPLSADVIVPAEGVHIEPVAGKCVLQIPTGGQKTS